MTASQKIGKFKESKRCRFCNSSNVYRFLDLGYQPLAGGFLKKGQFGKEEFYPLSLHFCNACFLVQTTAVIHKNKLFRNYFYHSSAIKTLEDHFKKNAKILSKFFKSPKNSLVFEIGCNDSNFLSKMRKNKFKILGIDPAENIVKPLIKKNEPIINDYFSCKKAKQMLKKYGKVDLIVSTNTLAHIENMSDIFAGIHLLLNDNGFLYFENHYLGSLLKDVQYDMVYHEHLYYYSLLTLTSFLEQHRMQIFDVRKIPVHGGSIGLFVQKINGPFKVKKSVKDLQNWEKRNNLDKAETFKKFSNEVKKQKQKLLELLSTLKKKNKIIVGYGASGRGTVISNYCGLNKKLLEYVIDDSTVKQGYYTPGEHLKIVSSTLNNRNRPDYTLLFAWSFLEEIKNRNKMYQEFGGRFIVPLPKVKII